MKKIIHSLLQKIDNVKSIHKALKKKKEEKNKEDTAQEIVFGDQPKASQKMEIDVPIVVIVKVLFVVALFFIISELIVQLQSILMTTLICAFLAIGLTPILQSMEKRKIPRPLAILILYLLFLGGLTILFFMIIPVIIDQLQPIVKNISHYFGEDYSINNTAKDVISEMESLQLQDLMSSDFTQILEKLQSYFQNVMGATFSILSDIFQGVFNVIFALVLLFFMLLERETLGRGCLSVFSKERQDYIITKTKRVQDKMATWFRGQFILMIAVGLFMYIGMKIFEYTLGMEYAATIGLLAAFMELFPYIGVFTTGIFAILIAYNISWTLVIAVLLWIALTQFLEGNFLVPIVMEKVTGLSSVVVMLALAIGGILGNAAGGIALSILGMIFAVPIAASIAIFLEEYVKKKNTL